MTRAHVGFGLLVGLASVSALAHAQEFEPRFGDTQHFTVDPVVDGVLIGGGTAFSVLLNAVLSTGEIRPTVPGDPNILLPIDRGAVTQTINPNAGTYSNYGLYVATAYALLDPILSGVRDGRGALLVDGIMYAESITLTLAFTDATKIAVRRPRPIDYATCAESTTGTCASNTDLQLSFFSGHVAYTAAISATASYLAFIRSGPRSRRPWITLGAGAALTAFVAYMRVTSGEHFPTDVIMASLAGAGVGVLVPHFHRRPHRHGEQLETPPVWIGYAPVAGGGGSTPWGRGSESEST